MFRHSTLFHREINDKEKLSKLINDLKINHPWYGRIVGMPRESTLKRIENAAKSIASLAKLKTLSRFPEETSKIINQLLNLLNSLCSTMNSHGYKFEHLRNILIFTIIDLKPHLRDTSYEKIIKQIIKGLKKSSASYADAEFLYAYRDIFPDKYHRLAIDALYAICIFNDSLNCNDVDDVLPILLDLFSWASPKQQLNILRLLNCDEGSSSTYGKGGSPLAQPTIELMMQLLELRDQVSNECRFFIDGYIMRSIKREAHCWGKEEMLILAEPLLSEKEYRTVEKNLSANKSSIYARAW